MGTFKKYIILNLTIFIVGFLLTSSNATVSHAIVGVHSGVASTITAGGIIGGVGLGGEITTCATLNLDIHELDTVLGFLQCMIPVYGNVNALLLGFLARRPDGIIRTLSELIAIGGIITLDQTSQIGITLRLNELDERQSTLLEIEESTRSIYNQNRMIFEAAYETLQSNFPELNIFSTDFDFAFRNLVGLEEANALQSILGKRRSYYNRFASGSE